MGYYNQPRLIPQYPERTAMKVACGQVIEHAQPQLAPAYYAINMLTANNALDFALSGTSLFMTLNRVFSRN